MKFKKICLENVGPIDQLRFEFPTNDNETPKPVVIVGKNGSGKSVVLGNLVNAMISAHSLVYDDGDVEEGKVYKLRSALYIRRGQHYYIAEVEFDNNETIKEIQADRPKKIFEETLGFTPADRDWNRIKPTEISLLLNSFHPTKNKEKLDEAIFLYFPPNRFEDPAWLNRDNLNNHPVYTEKSAMWGHSGRPIIQYSPLRQNQNWLLDIIFDTFSIERKTVIIPQPNGVPLQQVLGGGPASKLFETLIQFLQLLFEKEGNVSIGVGHRGSRTISVTIDGEVVASNLFSLSTGQLMLMNLFLSILRTADLSGGNKEISELQGIVVIDEVDLHLHSDLQHRLLPEILSMFPKIQFIFSTHSPLFLLGMRAKFGEQGCCFLELPTGSEVDIERFSEFESAYEYFKDTVKFERELQNKLSSQIKPRIYVEGATDIAYITKAAGELGRNEILEKIQLEDGGGKGGLDKVLKHFNTRLAHTAPQKNVLLYDCDVDKSDKSEGLFFIRVIPRQPSKITDGIENLLVEDIIEQAYDANSKFFDIFPEHKKIIAGDTEIVPEQWKVNKSNKTALCQWVVENGGKEAFSRFATVFDIIEDLID